ncbi:hypothetical protein PWT90_02080 [Aphanocladium album]|nr:hypothetical protein PWT90_02080 [Aphanocladium album]
MRSVILLPGSGLFVLARAQAPTKLPVGVYEMPLRRINGNDAYGMDIGVGTPPQKVTLLVDTGSNTYSVESPNDVYCQQGMCKETGTYDNKTSSTSKYINSGFNNVVSSLGYGDVLSDTLTVGGSSLPDMEFGYMQGHSRNPSRPLPAIAGLSLQCANGTCDNTQSFTQALYEKGYIRKRAYSVFLGPGDGSVPAQLVMGGGQAPGFRDGGVIGQVVLSGISLRQGGRANVDDTYEGDDKKVLWDTGSPWWYAPVLVFRSVTQYFGLADAEPYDGRLEVDCKYREVTDDKLVGAYGDREMTVKVSMAKYITETDVVPIA